MGSNPPEKPKRKIGPMLYFFGTLAICGLASLLGATFFLSGSSAAEDTGPKPTNTPGRIIFDDTPIPETGSEAAAWTACERFVSEELKAPATAEFSGFDTEIVDVGSGRYTVRGYVDAENALGATLRHDYECKVEHRSGISYTLLDLSVTPR